VAIPETNPKSPVEQGEAGTPEDVATLYSWANLHGAKYRDFSASRAQAREEARQRAEEAAAEEKRRQEEEAERQRQEEVQLAARLAAEAAEAARQAEIERLAEIARQAEAERQAVLAAQEAQRTAAQRVRQPESHPELHRGAYDPAGTSDPQQASSFFGIPPFDPAAGQAFRPYGAQPSGQPQNPDRGQDHFAGQNYPPAPQRQPEYRPQQQPVQYAQPSVGQPRPFQNPPIPASQFSSPHYPAEPYSMSHQDPQMPSPWIPAEMRERETREPASRPAWLASEQPVNQPPYPPMQTPVPMYAQPPGSGSGSGQGPGPVDDTLLGSRDRIANRWYALKTVFDPQAAPAEPQPAQPPARVPVLAVFSLAGGVGKTSLVASLGRALSARGERVLLVDTAAYGLLPFFFGARDQRPGMLRTFNPPGVSADAPIQLVTLDPEGLPPEYVAGPNQPVNQDPNQHPPQASSQDWLAQEVARYTRTANRVLVDLPTASGSTTRRVLRLAPVVLVPVLPDMNSVVSVGAIEAFFHHNGNGLNTGGKQIMPYYVLNQFDYSLPLHLDVREILREQIGDRLLPFALRRSPAVSEALAEGMTVMDYAPGVVVAEDYANLAGWVRSLDAPATQSYRGVRWSER
jgi:cellulose synthase operon protein YhjQ